MSLCLVFGWFRWACLEVQYAKYCVKNLPGGPVSLPVAPVRVIVSIFSLTPGQSKGWLRIGVLKVIPA